MDKAGSLHSSVPAPPPRLYLPRNFSCSACLYGSLAEPCKGGCSPDADAAPALVLRGAADDEKQQQQQPPQQPPPAPPPPPARGREPSLPAVPPSPSQRRRAKSLPTPGERSLRPAPRHSPSRRKTVRFADSLGLELTSVHHFCEADLPRVPLPEPPAPRAAHLLKARKPPALGELEPVLFGPPAPPLEPLFPPQPGASPGFAERVRRHKVRLEWVRAEPAGLRGAVRVLNVAYEKAVSVRYTLNGWASCAEVPAAYQPPAPPDGSTDRFAFLLPLGFTAADAALEFAVRYRVAGAEYWDNNGGENYRLRGRQRLPPHALPPQDPDSTAWVHFI